MKLTFELPERRQKKGREKPKSNRLLLVCISILVMLFYVTFVGIVFWIFKTMWHFEVTDALDTMTTGAFTIMTVFGVCITFAFRWIFMLHIKDTNPDLTDEIREEMQEEISEMIEEDTEGKI